MLHILLCTVLFFGTALSTLAAGFNPPVEGKQQSKVQELTDGFLYIQKRHNRKIKKIAVGSKMVVFLQDREVRGVLTKVEGEHLTIELMEKRQSLGEEDFHFNDILAVSVRNSKTLAAGIGILTAGAVIFTGGVLYLIVNPAPALGLGGVVVGGAMISMTPTLFKYGKKYHLDGEWRLYPR